MRVVFLSKDMKRFLLSRSRKKRDKVSFIKKLSIYLCGDCVDNPADLINEPKAIEIKQIRIFLLL